MPNKQFSERLNKELDTIGLPPQQDERVVVFAKLLKVPRFKAEALLNGLMTPDTQLLDLLAEELEVNGEWLVGKSEHRQRKTRAN
jgi:hypothetical protein